MELKVFDEVEIVSTGQRGKIIILIGCPPREAYLDVYPGADAGYEYMTMWDEIHEQVEVRALNKYPIKDLK